jgi:hypothetical protein
MGPPVLAAAFYIISPNLGQQAAKAAGRCHLVDINKKIGGGPMKPQPIILAPDGLPWRSFLIGACVGGICFAAAISIFGQAAEGGAFIVSALVGIGAFAASLK